MSKSGIKRKTIIIWLVTTLLYISCLNRESSGREKGPLFLQVHFTNPLSDISAAQLKRILSGQIDNFKDIGGPKRRIRIYTDRLIHNRVKNNYPALKSTKADFRKNTVLSSKKSFLGISDINGLMPHFKVLYIENTLPWGKINSDYSLSAPGKYSFKISGVVRWIPENEITVIQTGVTAMTRAFIRSVEKKGDILYPIKYTRRITSQADIAATSNEVSFLDPCRYPHKSSLTFCSPKKYFDILLKSGFDIIELTGNHNNDYGYKYNRDTIYLLKREGLLYYGGGLNIVDAEKVLYTKIKNAKIAFIGFNQWGPAYAWATDTKPGAARLSKTKYINSIKEAVKNADIVFVSVQWGNENNPVPHRIQKEYFRLAAKLGATIMVSSSAHRAMGIEFFNKRFISYGLGNFLFDQMQSVYHRRGVIARHHFYNKRHIQTELLPYMIYNYSQPRLLNGKEAERSMNYIFRYSLGEVFGK